MPNYAIGKYAVKITGQGFQAAKTGTMQFVLKFIPQGMIDPSDPNTLIACQQYERTYYKALTENTMPWFLDDVKALGVEDLAAFSQLDPNTDGFIDLTGRDVDMACGPKQGWNDGKTYEDWAIIHGGGGGKPIELAPKKEVANLDKMFGRFLPKPARPTQPVARRTPVPVPVMADDAPAIDDDDVPF
jgi:hypothetical protein